MFFPQSVEDPPDRVPLLESFQLAFLKNGIDDAQPRLTPRREAKLT
jgi:hypothetical protein